MTVEHIRSSFGFGDFRDWIGLKNKRRKFKCKLVGLGEVGVIVLTGGMYLLINTFSLYFLDLDTQNTLSK